MMQPLLERLRPLILGVSAAPSTPTAPATTALQPSTLLPKLTTAELSELRYDVGEESVDVRFVKGDDVVASLTVDLVDISFYAKQHLLKRPQLLDCGVELAGPSVTRFLIPTGRSRTAGNGSVAVKYYDISKPVSESDIEPFERVGIRPPTGVFTYAFFEAQYLARSEDPRKGALFLIDPRMILLQYPMTEVQREEFQTFGGKKVLYFDVLGSPNIQEREEEIKRCRIRGDEQKRQYEEADRRWEEERIHRLQEAPAEEADKSDKSKVSKKAKQKARKAAKAAEQGPGRPKDDEEEEEARAEAEDERRHKQRQADCRAKAEDDARRERELEVERRKVEVAETKRRHEQEEARMRRVKSLLQKVQSKLPPANGGSFPEGPA